MLFFQHVFEYFTERTPRSHLDDRATSLVWNYKYAGTKKILNPQLRKRMVLFYPVSIVRWSFEQVRFCLL